VTLFVPHLSFKFVSIFVGAGALLVGNQRQSGHSIANRTKTLLDHCPLKRIRKREEFPLSKLGVLVVLIDGELGTPQHYGEMDNDQDHRVLGRNLRRNVISLLLR